MNLDNWRVIMPIALVAIVAVFFLRKRLSSLFRWTFLTAFGVLWIKLAWYAYDTLGYFPLSMAIISTVLISLVWIGVTVALILSMKEERR